MILFAWAIALTETPPGETVDAGAAADPLRALVANTATEATGLAVTVTTPA